MSAPAANLSLAVPAYFHPAVSTAKWRRLVEHAFLMRFVIVNVHNGPGEAPDPSYLPIVESLSAAGIRIVGYVDTDYGRRAPADVAQEVRTYREFYGLRGVFLDQVSSGLEQLDHYAQCVVAARTAGASFVVLNAGAEPHPGYVDLANVTVTFEGTWNDYKALQVSDWVHRYPRKRFCHLVHSLPPGNYAEGLGLAAERHVGSVFLTSGHGSNPWDRVPPSLVTEITKVRAQEHAPMESVKS
ncbi:spherulation-specific family 4 protein [Demequina aurantiaca]|uniref:spherulation-specific family 4 protein n=1 Tax=Demequina aurantiaca TaxID=676200 RepID=UPI003D342090